MVSVRAQHRQKLEDERVMLRWRWLFRRAARHLGCHNPLSMCALPVYTSLMVGLNHPESGRYPVQILVLGFRGPEKEQNEDIGEIASPAGRKIIRPTPG